MFLLPVGSKRMNIKNQLIPRRQLRYPRRRVDIRLRMTNLLLLAPSSFVIISFPYVLTQTDEIVYLEIQSICWTALTIWVILSVELSMKCILASGSMTDIKRILWKHGYCILNHPSFFIYPELTAFVQSLSLPMLINVQLPGVISSGTPVPQMHASNTTSFS